MIAAFLLAAAAAPPRRAVDAERAFAADAQQLGQWTAFRKYATADALMFTPQPVNAQEFLKPLKDPPVSVYWWPGKSFVSCDGTYAVNTGPWVRQYGKAVGYFTTVWQRQPDGGWKWIYDGGDGLKVPRAEGGDIKPRTASCKGEAIRPARAPVPPGFKAGEGASNDRTLWWSWKVDAKGGRTFRAYLWTGRKYEQVLINQVPAP